MKITVAVPCYNLEERIATCLESVISQDFQEMEILVIDDHSTDRSVEIVRDIMVKHPEREFHFIVNETNLGINHVRNMAIDKAKGEALFFVDGDDTIELGTLSLLHRRMEECQAEVVYGSYRKNNYEGNTFFTKQYSDASIKGSFAFASYIEKYNNGSFCVAVWNNLYRLDFIKSHAIYCDTHYRNYEDCLFTFKVALHAQSISFIPNVTYNYYDVPVSISHKKIDLNFFNTYRAVIESVFNAKNIFESCHKDVRIPRGISFLLNYICLTNGCLKRALESEVSKCEKKQFLKWLRELYGKYGMNWSSIEGAFNRISYLILKSPFSYPLFCFYFKHLKTIAKIVNYITAKKVSI